MVTFLTWILNQTLIDIEHIPWSLCYIFFGHDESFSADYFSSFYRIFYDYLFEDYSYSFSLDVLIFHIFSPAMSTWFLDLSFILSFNHSLMNSLMICLLFWSHSWSKIIITCMHAQVISKIQVQCVLLVEGTVEFEWRLERTWIVINWSHEDSQLYFEGWFGYN